MRIVWAKPTKAVVWFALVTCGVGTAGISGGRVRTPLRTDQGATQLNLCSNAEGWMDGWMDAREMCSKQETKKQFC